MCNTYTQKFEQNAKRNMKNISFDKKINKQGKFRKILLKIEN